jgi:hypothetical protein
MDSDRPESGDPLEAELSGLRPAALTGQLVARIRLELEGDDTNRRGRDRARVGRRWMIGAIAAGVAAAIVATPLIRHDLFHRMGTASTRPDEHFGPRVSPVVRAAAPDGPVTLAAYRSALTRSPEDALALLDRQASGSRPDASPRAFGRLTVAEAHGETDVP